MLGPVATDDFLELLFEALRASELDLLREWPEGQLLPLNVSPLLLNEAVLGRERPTDRVASPDSPGVLV